MLLIAKGKMKKLLSKIKLGKKKESDMSPSRITNDTVAEYRERVLAGGRRFKYPLQYARHKLVFNTIIISVATLLILAVLGWAQLYMFNNTGEFMYRVTKVVPVPVATVDGQTVLYSDYLMKYRSAIYYLEQKEQVNLKTDDGKRQIEYVKEQSMQDAVADAYALKLAKDMGLSVSDNELEEFLQAQRQSDDGEITEQTYNAVIKDYYNWSPDEYKHATKNKLLRQKVAYALDEKAENTSKDVQTKIKTGATNLKELADNTPDATYRSSGWVPKTNQDGGLAMAAALLGKDEVSSKPIKSLAGDGYYFVKLIDSNSTQVNYEYIHIPLSAFDAALTKIIKDGDFKQYIDVPISKD